MFTVTMFKINNYAKLHGLLTQKTTREHVGANKGQLSPRCIYIIGTCNTVRSQTHLNNIHGAKLHFELPGGKLQLQALLIPLIMCMGVGI